MKKYKEINTLQYMGSKSRIISDICNPIMENENITTVVDLFAGTGTVGYALKENKSVISNDIECYAYILNQAILNGCIFPKEHENVFLDQVYKIFNIIENKVSEAITAEAHFFVGETDYKEYKKFCESTPSVFSYENVNKELSCIEKLVKKITPGKKNESKIPSLFLTYYANTYFGIKQCCQIDAIRKAIDFVDSNEVKNVLLTVLMSVMSFSASTTTHFAQYLKVNSIATCNNLIEKRKIDIIEEFKVLLGEYRDKGLCEKSTRSSRCYNLDYVKCLEEIEMDNQTLVYADPPYFKEHYSRYYHVLNTLCQYDYPKISINPQTKDYSVGRYREDRMVSDFGKKAKALGAFEILVNKCASAGAWLMISYSDNSIVAIEDIEKLAQEKYNVAIKRIEINHSRQGRSATSKVDEYIFLCSPQNDKNNVDEILDKIKCIKPIVDNPAGFMHNYMARKPYNIISELIQNFCPVNGCVYDPMFGSGTTIIEASKLNRRAIGTDINKLAYKLCKVSLTQWDLTRVNDIIDSFCSDIRNACEDIYSFNEDGEIRILERCHFDKCNELIVPVSYWYKRKIDNKLSGRKKAEASEIFKENYRTYSNYEPQNIENNQLIPNSRIAIGTRDTVHMYFCNRNLVAIDRIKECLNQYKGRYGYDALELLVSSAVNLIKLSDKKASSQMPYWLPKKDVTSRNAVMVIENKANKFKEGLRYLHDNCKLFIDEAQNDSKIFVYNVPAQCISSNVLADNSVDLILTDPPYTDQVPYLEYSQLWYGILGWDGFEEKILESELVVSDAPSRKKDVVNFHEVFTRIIERISPALKVDGYLIMFYHSFNLNSWSNILELMQSNGLMYCGQIASSAPRKSFKTVMTPKGTLDGNYIIVFQKKKNVDKMNFKGTIEDAERLAIKSANKIISEHSDVTSQELYDAGMLKDAIEKGYLSILSKKYKTFVDVIADDFIFENGFWRKK